MKTSVKQAKPIVHKNVWDYANLNIWVADAMFFAIPKINEQKSLPVQLQIKTIETTNLVPRVLFSRFLVHSRPPHSPL